jgi:diguanylate cyclase (GGDEF)-like protein
MAQCAGTLAPQEESTKWRKAVNYSLRSEVHPAPERPLTPCESNLATRISVALCALVSVALILTAVLSVRTLTGLVSAENPVTQDLVIEKVLQNLMSQLVNAETGQRGFLLSRLPTYLEPYYAALTEIRESRAAAIKFLSSEPSAIGELGMLDIAITAKLKELNHNIGLESAGRIDEASEVVRTGIGKRTMDDVREAIRLLVAGVDRRTEQARAKQSKEIRNSYWILAFSLVVNLLLLAGVVQRMRNASAQGRIGRELMETRNDALLRSLEVAAIRNDQVRGLAELGQLLQACVDMEEAVRLLQHHVPPLMKASSGAMYFFTASSNQLHKAFQWGGQPYHDRLEPSDCWALRLGKLYRQPAEAGAGTCTHLTFEHPIVSESLYCLPLMVHGELTALLVLEAHTAIDQRKFAENEVYRRIALEQVALSIGNLKLRESLRQQSVRDMLTGLYNRRYLEESVRRELLRSARLQAHGRLGGLSVLMIDIDHFKRFNDEYGHHVGDQVLREVAQVLKSQTRGGDVAARFGGEEFIVVLTDTPPGLALERAEQMRWSVENLAPASGGALPPVTISIGLVEFPPDGNTLEALLVAADKALYEAKRAGRNRVVVASSVGAVVPFRLAS